MMLLYVQCLTSAYCNYYVIQRHYIGCVWWIHIYLFHVSCLTKVGIHVYK